MKLRHVVRVTALSMLVAGVIASGMLPVAATPAQKTLSTRRLPPAPLTP